MHGINKDEEPNARTPGFRFIFSDAIGDIQRGLKTLHGNQRSTK